MKKTFLVSLIVFLLASTVAYAAEEGSAADTVEDSSSVEESESSTGSESEEPIEDESVDESDSVDESSSQETLDEGEGVETLGEGEEEGEGEMGYSVDEIPSPSSPLEPKSFFQTSLFTGSASYNYPLDVPPGTNGLTPRLSLSYSSQGVGGRSGWVGLGWDVSLSYIQRDVNSSPDYLGDDEFRLVLNGQGYDLVYVESDGRYHTTVESYLFVEKRNDSGVNEKGVYWLVRSKDGVEYRFGYNNDSERVCSVRDYVLKWSLDEVRDAHGNRIFYSYSEDPCDGDVGSVYLDKIEYNNDKTRVVDFVLEDSVKPDVVSVFDEGCVVRESRRLREIKIEADGVLVRRYVLDYSIEDTKSLLRSITEYGSDNISSYPADEFNYSMGEINWSLDDGWVIPTIFSKYYIEGGSSSYSVSVGSNLVDVNGDGLIDIIRASNRYQNPNIRMVWLNNGSEWIENESWNIPADFVKEGPDWSVDLGVRLSDVNGDGLVDFLRSYYSGGFYGNNVWLNNGSGWVLNSSWVIPTEFVKYKTYDKRYSTDLGTRLVDVNGDGLVDVLRSYDDANDEYDKLDYID